MNEYLETLRIRISEGDPNAQITLDLALRELEIQNQRQIERATARGNKWEMKDGVVCVLINLENNNQP